MGTDFAVNYNNKDNIFREISRSIYGYIIIYKDYLLRWKYQLQTEIYSSSIGPGY